MLLEYKDRHELPDETAVSIFDHIKRTGGTSLKKLFSDHYGDQARNLNFSTIIGAYPEIRELKSIIGHGTSGLHRFLPKEKPCFYFTFLRHPLKQRLSQYLYINTTKHFYDEDWTGKSLDFQVFTDTSRNTLINWLGNGDSALAEDVLFGKYAYFGITELYVESVYGLSEILPWLKGKTLLHGARTSATKSLGKLAEERFLERNSKDLELYEKAVKEFKKRVPGHPCMKMQIDDSIHDITSHNVEIINSLKNLKELPPELLPAENKNAHLLWTALYSTQNDDCMEHFYNLLKSAVPALRKQSVWNENMFNIVAFYCNCIFGRGHEMNMYGNAVFDALDELDGQNKVTTIVWLRMEILEYLLSNWPVFMAAIKDGEKGFSGRCLDWLSSLRLLPEWSAAASNSQAILLEKYGKIAEALDSARNAVAADPDNIKFHDDLCRLLLATNALAEAETTARHELAKNPDSEWALRQLGLALSAKGDRLETGSVLKKAYKKNPCCRETQKALLYFLYNESEFAEAESMAKKSLAYDPPWADHLHFFLSCLYETCGEFEKALVEIRTAMDMSPGIGVFHMYLSRLLETCGETDASFAEIQKAIAKEPHTVTFRESYTQFLLRHNRAGDAEKDARENIAAFPESGWPILQLSKIKEVIGTGGGGGIVEGLECARKAYALQPGKISLAANLAHFLRLAGNDDEFEEFCREALERDPRQGWVWRERCRMAEARGNRALALELGMKALQVHPEDSDFRRYYNTLVSSPA